jgi:phosphatidate cytidylyltransferase
MSKLVQRLLIFFIGIPLVLGIVFLDFYNNILINIFICFFAVAASWELYNLFEKNAPLLPKPLVLSLSGMIPMGSYVFICLGLPFNYITWLLLFGILILMGYEALTAKTFGQANLSLTLSAFILFYGGYLVTYITRLTAYKLAAYYMGVFLFLVFMCDSFAWLFGMLWGKNNRGVVAASPNKSIVGFVGGYIGCITAAIITRLIFPEVFSGPVWKSFILGILIATSAIIGDLVESVFKRSSNCKDSGFIMPGRGGVLDSIDSILYSAPVFYILLHFLYGIPLL